MLTNLHWFFLLYNYLPLYSKNTYYTTTIITTINERSIIINKNTDLLIARFQLGKSHDNAFIGNEVLRGKIGGSCIAIRSEIARKFQWPRRGAGDFFFINQVVKKYNPVFISMVAGKVQKDLQHSWGVRKNYWWRLLILDIPTFLRRQAN